MESESLQLQLRRDRQKMGGMIERSNELEQSIGAANGTNAGLAQLGAEMAVRGAGAIFFHFHSMTEYSANFNAICNDYYFAERDAALMGAEQDNARRGEHLQRQKDALSSALAAERSTEARAAEVKSASQAEEQVVRDELQVSFIFHDII